MENNVHDICIRNTSKDAATVLKRIELVARNSKSDGKKAIPSVFLVGNKGMGNSSFASKYENILASHNVYMVRGAKTYLELVFPKNGSETDYQRFFQSPKLVAALQNSFYGVFSISLEEWEGMELLGSEQFKNLLSFIDNHKNTIYFVLQVTNEFKAKEELKRILYNHINMLEVHLEYPDAKEATDYIRLYLKKEGIEFSEDGSNELQQFLIENLNIKSTIFAGFHSLQQIAQSIQFELETQNREKNHVLQVNKDMFRNIEGSIIMPKTVEKNNHTVGFRM